MQKIQINNAYAHYTVILMALGSQNIMPKDIFVKMCEMMFFFKENNSNQNYNQLKEWQSTKHNKIPKSKESRPNKNKEKNTESPQKQKNDALDIIIFIFSKTYNCIL